MARTDRQCTGNRTLTATCSGAGGAASHSSSLCFWCGLAGISGRSNDTTTFAYVGPGAGFAFLGSFLSLVTGALLGAFSLLTWPVRIAWRSLRRGRAFRHATVKKIIFLGLDGLDPRLTERFLREGKLPNLAKLVSTGSYKRLRTTFPSLSPVAWSTFATGVNPAKHNIFDFLDRDLKSYLPQLSSARVGHGAARAETGEAAHSTVPAHPGVPPQEPAVLGDSRRERHPFYGAAHSHYLSPGEIQRQAALRNVHSRPEGHARKLFAIHHESRTGVLRERLSVSAAPLRRHASKARSKAPRTHFSTTPRPCGCLSNCWSTAAPRNCGSAHEVHALRQGEYTPWIRLDFRTAMHMGVSGIVRFLLTSTSPEVSLYMSPINIDPEKPALPISQPAYYAAYLANLIGPFATTGMAEDTWALNERVIDSDAFLKQAWDIFEERESMFLRALENTRRGVVACVFDTSDRIQHMFYRQFQDGTGEHAGVIEDLYRRMDTLVGKAAGSCRERHGFLRPFRSRLLLVSPRSQPQFVAASERLPGAERRRVRQHFPSRRRLVADQGVCPGSRWRVPEPEGTRSAGHGRAGRRSRGTQKRADRQTHGFAGWGCDSGGKRVCHRCSVQRSLPRSGAGPDCGL